MAQSGNYTPIKTYSSETASAEPAAVNLEVGELAVNIPDQKIFTKNSSEEIVTLSGNRTVDYDVTYNGDITNNGDVVNNGTTSMNGDVLVDGNTLETYIQTTVNTGSAPGSDGKHRYWRIGFGVEAGDTSAEISDGTLWTGGKGFENGRRWNKGVPIDISGVTWGNFLVGQGDTTPTANAWERFFTGEIDSVILGYTGSSTTASRSGVELDFGEGNEVFLSGLDINGRVAGVVETVDIVEFSYSDNGSDWTVASTVSGIRASTGADVDPSIDLPHIGNIGDTTPNTLFDESKATIPYLDTSGGGGGTDYWTFDYTIKNNENWTAQAGYYYFVEGNNLDPCTVTLPSSPATGTRVGFCLANHGSAISSADSGPGGVNSATCEVTIQDSGTNVVTGLGDVTGITKPTSFLYGSAVAAVELIYINGDWQIMNIITYTFVE
jgi:hypothetical protein